MIADNPRRPLPDGPPAFPENRWKRVGEVKEGTSVTGMTLRDYFAAAALQGLLGNSQIAKDAVKEKIGPETNQTWHAETAYAMADAMLKHRTTI